MSMQQDGGLSCKSVLLATVDGFLSLFVFFPLAILHWRGTWGLQDVYFVPNDVYLSNWMSLVIGTITSILLALFQPVLQRHVTPADGVWYLTATRLHMYVGGWTTMCYWRGVWNLLDLYLTEEWKNSVALLVVAQIFTFASKTSRNNVGLPVSNPMLDTDAQLLAPDTALKVDPKKWLRYLGDVLFTQLLVVTANIVIWRGIWNVYDAFLFPHRHLLSDLASLAVGYISVGVFFILQYPLSLVSVRLSDCHSSWPKIIYEDVVMFVLTWGNLLLWRGAWDLCLLYVLPDPLIGGWVSHWVGTWGLIVLQMFNNVAMNGIELDGQYPRGEGIFPLDYLRELLLHSKEIGELRTVTVLEMDPLLSDSMAGLSDGSQVAQEEDDGDDDSGVSLEQEQQTAPLLHNGAV